MELEKSPFANRRDDSSGKNHRWMLKLVSEPIIRNCIYTTSNISLRGSYSLQRETEWLYSGEAWKLAPDDRVVNVTSPSQHLVLPGITRRGHSASSLHFCRKHINLITRKHQTNPNWQAFCKITGLYVFFNNIQVLKDKENLRVLKGHDS